MTATELHATRLAEAQARIAAEAARRGPAAAKALSDRMEREADVAAMIAAVPERGERRYRWSCAKCAEPMRTAERPPSPQLCARCRPEVLEMFTEPAARAVYGDESEDDGLPIALPPATTPGLPERVWVVPEFNNPAPSEGIQTDTSPRAPAAAEERAVTATKEPPAKAAEKKPESNCARCGNPPTPVGRKQTRTLVHVDGQEVCGKCMNKIVAARQREAGIKPGPTAKAEPKPLVTFACDRCGRKDFPGERERNGHMAWCGKKRGAVATEPIAARPVSDEEATFTSGTTVPIRAPDLRAFTVRLRGPVPLEIECATVEDAAAFVRLVGATTGAGVEARG